MWLLYKISVSDRNSKVVIIVQESYQGYRDSKDVMIEQESYQGYRYSKDVMIVQESYKIKGQ